MKKASFRSLMHARGWTVEQLAERMSLTPRTAQRLVAGRRMRISTLLAALEALQPWTIDELEDALVDQDDAIRDVLMFACIGFDHEERLEHLERSNLDLQNRVHRLEQRLSTVNGRLSVLEEGCAHVD